MFKMVADLNKEMSADPPKVYNTKVFNQEELKTNV